MAKPVVIDWNKGSARIVPALERGEMLQVGKIKQRVTSTQPPFAVAYAFEAYDGGHAPTTPTSRACPSDLWDAAWRYQSWIFDGARGAMPELGLVAEALCQGRISFALGCGGTIWLENREDADALMTYFGNSALDIATEQLYDIINQNSIKLPIRR
jgi:hypothetical protein